MAFWFATAQAKAGGFSSFLSSSSLASVLFSRCGGDRRVLAVLRPGVHLWNLAEVRVCFCQSFACLRCVCACCFQLGACFFFTCKTGGSINTVTRLGTFRRISGGRLRGTPTGPVSLFQAQSVLMTS